MRHKVRCKKRKKLGRKNIFLYVLPLPELVVIMWPPLRSEPAGGSKTSDLVLRRYKFHLPAWSAQSSRGMASISNGLRIIRIVLPTLSHTLTPMHS